MITKTISQIRQDIVSAFQAKIPALDLTEGSPERDMFIEAPISGAFINTWNDIIYSAKLHAPIIYYQDLKEEDINNYCLNFNVTPAAPTYSTGTVTFYTYNTPSADIHIPAGTNAQTLDSTPIVFATEGSYIMYKAFMSSYYNTVTGRYEINIPVQAVNSGASSRAVANAVSKITSSISGIDGCVNNDIISGGTDTDTPKERLQRVIAKFQGRNIASTSGLQSYVSTLAQSVNIIGARDSEMLRDLGLGGAIDVYVRGSDIISKTDSITITSIDPLLQVVDVSSTGYVMAYQPVDAIQSVVYNGVLLDPTYYHLVKDTGLLSKSTRSYDKVALTSTGIAHIGYFSVGKTLVVTYTFNNLLTTINTTLTNPSNHYYNRDYLVREMTPVTINFYARIKESAGYDFATVISTVSVGVDTVISALGNNQNVEIADIIGGIKNLPGVDNIDLTTVSITNIGGGSKTTQGDVILSRNEYPVTGTITIVQWI